MKFALANGQRQEAQPGLSGICQGCGLPMIAKCGERRIHHWAHRSRRHCDPWWENESEWHRGWKNQFPIDWQEIRHQAPEGNCHIADVKTERGWVLEFQHSYLKPEVRRSREAFYPKLVWVVDGTRRKRDWTQFVEAWNRGAPVGVPSTQLEVRLVHAEGCALLQEWAGSDAPMLFDFGVEQIVCRLKTSQVDGRVYVAVILRAEFVGLHGGGSPQPVYGFDELVRDFSAIVATCDEQRRAQALWQASPQLLSGVHQLLNAPNRRRRRF